MFEKAIVCTDLTPGSEELVACAGALRALGLREVLLTHVVDVFGDLPAQEQADSDLFARQTETLEALGFQVRVDTPVGHPSHAIEEVAEREDASLIVMGARNRGLIEGAFSDSVSSDLINITSLPVLLAPYAGLPESRGEEVCARLLSHVLFPTDLSEAGERGLRALGAIVPLGVEAVTILHVFPRERGDHEHDAEAGRLEAGLHRVARSLETYGVDSAAVRLEYGTPAERVVEAANSGVFTMVVAAMPRGRGVQLPAESVAAALVADCLTPMLLIPPRSKWPVGRMLRTA